MTFEEKYQKSKRNPVADAPPVEPGTPSLPAMETLKAAAKVKDEYRAFGTQSQPQFDLWIRPNQANASPAIAIPYSRRATMIVDDGFFVIIMEFDSGPVLSLRLHGRNLEELFMKLLAHEAVYVREFDARKWSELAEGEPCITGIDLRYRPVPPPKTNDGLPGEQKTEPEKPSTH